MLGKPNMQKDFFNNFVWEHLLPKKHLLLDIKEKIDFSFVDSETRDLYSESTGRTSFPPQVLFRMLFLEFLYSLSDRDIVEQTQTNILFRYFVGLSIQQPTPDDTTLVVFRKRLGEDKFKALFNGIVLKAKELGLIQGNLKILDATHIIADIAIPNTVNLLRQGRKKAIESLSPEKEQAKLKQRYLDEEKVYKKPSKEQLTAEVELTTNFIKELQGQCKTNPEINKIIAQLDKMLNPQQDQARPLSFADPDARGGYKSPDKKFVGYKAHASLDNESQIITSVDTVSGNTNEGDNEDVQQLIQEDEDKGITHQAVAADALYDSALNRQTAHSKDMAAYIPSRNSGKTKFLDNFIYDKDADTLICPEGHSSISKTRQEQGHLYIFSTYSCKRCSNNYGCPKVNCRRSRVFISDDYLEKLIDHTPQRLQALIQRKAIERKFGEAKKWHNLTRARYRGRWRVAIQVLMTFLVINVKRIIKLFTLKSEPALALTGYG